MLLQAEALIYSILKESEKWSILDIQHMETRSKFATQQQSCKQDRWSDLPDTQGIGDPIDSQGIRDAIILK